MPIIERRQARYICDFCSEEVEFTDSTDTSASAGWLVKSVEHMLDKTFVVCPVCVEDSVMFMIYERNLQEWKWPGTNDWLREQSFCLAKWDNPHCPQCKEPWHRGARLRKSKGLDKWVHLGCENE